MSLLRYSDIPGNSGSRSYQSQSALSIQDQDIVKAALIWRFIRARNAKNRRFSLFLFHSFPIPKDSLQPSIRRVSVRAFAAGG